MATGSRHVPNFGMDEVERIRRWHEAAYEQLLAAGDRTVEYLGLRLDVPAGVFAPTPTSDLLGQAVLDRARAGVRVLDMGTGSGVNAILAATRGAEVIAVDLNPAAVAAARANVERHGVADRVTVVEGDLFEGVEGTFDLIVYDPPFRWFRPRDLVEAAMADEDYDSLARFFAQAPHRLSAGGSMLVFFGTSGDLAHLLGLAEQAGFAHEVVAERMLVRDEMSVWYRTFRMAVPGH
jgi:release factor glutamine methyltransferase